MSSICIWYPSIPPRGSQCKTFTIISLFSEDFESERNFPPKGSIYVYLSKQVSLICWNSVFSQKEFVKFIKEDIKHLFYYIRCYFIVKCFVLRNYLVKQNIISRRNKHTSLPTYTVHFYFPSHLRWNLNGV